MGLLSTCFLFVEDDQFSVGCGFPVVGEVVRLLGVAKSFVSDQDAKFVSKF